MDTYNLSNMEIDAVGEILNISLGASATAVSTMLDTRVDITTPVVKVKHKDEFEFASIEPAVGVQIGYVEGLDGSNIMLLKRIDVKVIVELLMGMEIPDEQFELDEMNISAICEVMNQMMGASATALSELLSRRVDISTPVSFEVESPEQFKEKYFAENDQMVVIRFNLMIADKMESEFLNLMPISLAKDLVSGFFPDGLSGGESAPAPEPAPAPSPAPQPQPSAVSDGGENRTMSQEEIERMLQGGAGDTASAPAPEPAPAPSGSDGGVMSQEAIEQMLQGGIPGDNASAAPPVQQEQPQPQPSAQQPVMQPQAQVPAQPQMPQAPVYMQPQMDPAIMNNMMQMMDMMRQSLEQQQQQIQQLRDASSGPKKLKVHTAPQPNLNADNTSDGMLDENLDMMMDVPMELSVEIGRTTKVVRDILELNKGSLVVLDKLAGEQVDLYVNGQCIAKGDVVVVEDNFGIRISEIV
ncbi:flagellar motor switch protein FliN [Lachnospiraceae bacterium MD308]|nr:flagellar motor switch protein FliN [Lachnospiraceae bacterium MD308]